MVKWEALLGGLVSITGPCPVVDPWAAVIIGFLGAFVYYGGALQLDPRLTPG